MVCFFFVVVGVVFVFKFLVCLFVCIVVRNLRIFAVAFEVKVFDIQPKRKTPGSFYD